MCLFGGGGGDGGASAREAERQRQIAETTARINAVFGDPSREAAYGTHRTNVLDLNMTDLDRSKQEADRALRFDLARRGVAGGSADVDAAAELLERYNRGVGDVSRHADTQAASLRAADEAAKRSLISQAQAGLDTGTAQRLALDSLGANLAEASSGARLQGLGNLFADLAYMNRAKAIQSGQAGARLPYDDTAVYPRTSSGSGYYGTSARIG